MSATINALNNIQSGGASTSNISGRKLQLTVIDIARLTQDQRDVVANAIAHRAPLCPQDVIGNDKFILGLVLTYTMCLFPDFKGIFDTLPALQINYQALDTAEVDAVLAHHNWAPTNPGDAKPDYQMPAIPGLFNRARGSSTFGDVDSHEGRVAQYALMMYATVKDWTMAGGENVFRVKRPEALVRAAGLSASTATYVQLTRVAGTQDVTGLGPSEHLLRGLNQTMSNYPYVRGAMYEQFIDWHRDTSATNDIRIINSITRLTAWHGMTYVRYIRALLRSRPGVAAIPEVNRELAEFNSSQRRLSNVPRTRQRYVKVIGGSEVEIHRRNDYPLLIALAVKMAVSDGETTMANYHVPQRYQEVADRIIAQMKGTPQDTSDEED